MKYKGIIFDLDGVICSTDQYHYMAWKKIAEEMNIYFDEKINHRLRGVSRMESLDIILEKYPGVLSKQEKENIATRKNQIYINSLAKMSKNDLPQHVKSTLEILKEKGYKLAIGSSSKNAKAILKQLDCIQMFDAISDGTNITHSKPDPEVFLKAAQYLNLKVSECLVVEDAMAGIDAAANGHFESVLLGGMSRYKKATYAIEQLDDLLCIL